MTNTFTDNLPEHAIPAIIGAVAGAAPVLGLWVMALHHDHYHPPAHGKAPLAKSEKFLECLKSYTAFGGAIGILGGVISSEVKDYLSGDHHQE
jgi:hypothetical protein